MKGIHTTKIILIITILIQIYSIDDDAEHFLGSTLPLWRTAPQPLLLFFIFSSHSCRRTMANFTLNSSSCRSISRKCFMSACILCSLLNKLLLVFALLFPVRLLEEKENNAFAATRKVKRTTNITNDSRRSKESIITTMMLLILSVFVYKIHTAWLMMMMMMSIMYYKYNIFFALTCLTKILLTKTSSFFCLSENNKSLSSLFSSLPYSFRKLRKLENKSNFWKPK